jgi:hypothetical protein
MLSIMLSIERLIQVSGKRRRNGQPVDDKDKKSFVAYEESDEKLCWR